MKKPPRHPHARIEDQREPPSVMSGLQRLERVAVREELKDSWKDRTGRYGPVKPDGVGGTIKRLPTKKSVKELEKQALRFQRLSRAYQQKVNPPKKRSGR